MYVHSGKFVNLIIRPRIYDSPVLWDDGKKDPHRINENFKGSPKIFTKLRHTGLQRNEEMKSQGKHSSIV